MKHAFKPLGIAAAVAAASAGYVNSVAAQDTAVARNDLGDLALVPYYTVLGEWITGIHIVNTSDQTQVVKFRFRRALDSLDALDFNIVMSPQDVYAGFLSDDAEGNISWSARDTTCTVPETTDGKLTMPPIYRGTPGEDTDASTGYVEIIAMGAADDDQPIYEAAEHDDGVPESCDAVRSNFFASRVSDDNDSTSQRDLLDFDEDDSTSDRVTNRYTDSGNILKVSYFLRDNESGVEFGDNAVHIENFLDVPSVTNQEFGYLSGDLNGFDFPDLDGSSPTGANASRNLFNNLRSPAVLGAAAIINEWVANEDNGAGLSWVVTMPGQYTMLNLPLYITALADEDKNCVRSTSIDAEVVSGPVDIATEDDWLCDTRDLPVLASLTAYDREEDTQTSSGELVVSPNFTPGVDIEFEKEVTVVTFGGNETLGVSDFNVNAGLDQPFGWLTMSLESASGLIGQWQWPTSDAGADSAIDVLPLVPDWIEATGRVPVIGMAAWERSVAANPDASYGRIVEHSYIVSSR